MWFNHSNLFSAHEIVSKFGANGRMNSKRKKERRKLPLFSRAKYADLPVCLIG